jgi:hypothetical protein
MIWMAGRAMAHQEMGMHGREWRIHEESTMPAMTNTPAELRAHITPDPDVPPPPPEKEPPPDNTPLPEEPPIEEPTPKQPPMKV